MEPTSSQPLPTPSVPPVLPVPSVPTVPIPSLPAAPVPSQPAQSGVPNAPQPTSPALAPAEPAEDLSELTPMAVLRRRNQAAQSLKEGDVVDPFATAPAQPAPPASVPAPVPAPSPKPAMPPAAPVPAPAVAPAPARVPASQPPQPAPSAPTPRPTPFPQQMSREELLRQAAEAPDQRLIVPPISRMQPLAPPPAPVPSSQPAAPVAVPVPSSAAASPMPPVPTPMPTPGLGAAALPTARPPRRSFSWVASLAGIVIVLAVLLGAGYVLARQGIRIPVLYSYVTGLKPKGLDQAHDAAVAVTAKGTYVAKADLTLKQAPSSGKPTLPASGADATAFSSFHVAASDLAFPADDSALEKAAITVDAGAEVPFELRADAQNATWLTFLPAQSAPVLAAVPADQMPNELTYPLLRPLPLTAILAAVKSETGAEKVTANGQAATRYHYGLDPAKVAAYFPIKAAFSSVTATVDYQWKSGLPLHAEVTATFAFSSSSYQYKGAWDYSGFGQGIAEDQHPGLKDVMTSQSTDTPVVPLPDFFTGLGLDYYRIPTSSGDGTPVPVPTPSATPAPSAAPSPTASWPIVPSGQSVTSAQAPITVIPPTPDPILSQGAITRDGQRLQDLADLQKALEAYKTKQGSYPKTQGIEQTRASQTLLSALVPTYLTGLPVDPLPTLYWYEYSSNGLTYRLRTVAEDPTDPKAIKGATYYYFEINQ